MPRLKTWKVCALIWTLPLALLACASEPELTPAVTSSTVCASTPPDMLGPYYKPDAPRREEVGQGYVLRGVVRSSVDCASVPEAQIEIWMAGPDGEYADEYRATLFADEQGAYHFESHFPPPYAGRPSHHHLRLSAPGYQTLVTQHYPQEGTVEAVFDLVLVPAP